MTSSQKTLNILSIIVMILGVLSVLLGIFLAVGGSALSGTKIEGVDASTLSITLGVLLIISGIVDTAIGFMGRRGAKDASKVKPFFIICIIGVVVFALSIIGSITTGDMASLPHYLLSLVLVIACLFFADKVKKEA